LVLSSPGGEAEVEIPHTHVPDIRPHHVHINKSAVSDCFVSALFLNFAALLAGQYSCVVLCIGKEQAFSDFFDPCNAEP